jgi:hypothetical protein
MDGSEQEKRRRGEERKRVQNVEYVLSFCINFK